MSEVPVPAPATAEEQECQAATDELLNYIEFIKAKYGQRIVFDIGIRTAQLNMGFKPAPPPVPAQAPPPAKAKKSK